MVSWKSAVDGPIPPHPMYDPQGRSTYCATPPPRVKGEGETIARRGQKGCVGNLMSMTVDGSAIGPRPIKSKYLCHSFAPSTLLVI